MSHLHRDLAPITADGWREIENEARRTLKSHLAARRVVDFDGPHGWSRSAVDLGRVRGITAPLAGVTAKLREVQPLIETRADFELARDELDRFARGAKDVDLAPVVAAARAAAQAEDRAVFHGFAAGAIRGIAEEAAAGALAIGGDFETFPSLVAQATGRLRCAGIDGPFALVLGPVAYTGLTETTSKGGYPVISHVRREIEGPIIWAPALDGALVLSTRGGDFELTVGQDFSIGYASHDSKTVRLYIEESFTFQALTPEAAVYLKHA